MGKNEVKLNNIIQNVSIGFVMLMGIRRALSLTMIILKCISE